MADGKKQNAVVRSLPWVFIYLGIAVIMFGGLVFGRAAATIGFLIMNAGGIALYAGIKANQSEGDNSGMKSLTPGERPDHK